MKFGFLGVVGAAAGEPPPAFATGTAGQIQGAGVNLAILGRDARFAGHAAAGDIELGFEGYLLHDARSGDHVARALLRRFRADGLRFVHELDGSFQIVIRDGPRCHLISDAFGSRRAFFARRGDHFVLAPRAAMLRSVLASHAIDRANVVQFLLHGRFFAGECALDAIRQPHAGEIVTFHAGQLSRARWHRYTTARDEIPGEFDQDAALAELAERVDRAAVAAYRHAASPAILLSGGYDARYLLNAILGAAPDRRALRTVSWGTELDRPGSDGAAAAALARRAGIRHIAIPRDLDALSRNLGAILDAQSGMTELALAHADELATCARLAAEHGITALLRGDEVFGPTGEVPGDLASARAESAARPLREADRAARWFVDDAQAFADAHRARVAELVRAVRDDPQGLRDCLYGDERLPAFLTHLSSHKLPALEIYNPLLSRDVVEFYRRLPDRCRADKSLFKRSYQRRFDDIAEIPIAAHTNALDWGLFIRSNRAVQAVLRTALARLPPPLSAEFFASQLDAVIAGATATTPLGAPPSPAQLVMRAAVLSWWLGHS